MYALSLKFIFLIIYSGVQFLIYENMWNLRNTLKKYLKDEKVYLLSSNLYHITEFRLDLLNGQAFLLFDMLCHLMSCHEYRPNRPQINKLAFLPCAWIYVN